MIANVWQLSQDGDMIEPWFLEAKQSDLELKNEIKQIEEGQVVEATRQANEANKPVIDAVHAKYELDQTEMKIEFIQYVIENFIEDPTKRTPIPAADERLTKRKFYRWFVDKVYKHLHPDTVPKELNLQKHLLL